MMKIGEIQKKIGEAVGDKENTNRVKEAVRIRQVHKVGHLYEFSAKVG